MARAVIRGLGPAGAVLAMVTGLPGVDVSRGYQKVCGEAVRVDTPMVGARHVLGRVRRFLFYVGDRLVGEVAYRHAKWFVIDKRGWVESMRERVEPPADPEHDLVIDARGPYAHRPETWVVTYRAYVAGGRPVDDSAVFVFPRGRTGFFWIFPHGEVLNVGAGFVGVPDARAELAKFVREWVGGSVIDMRASPIAIFSDTALFNGSTFRVGEAAGLVFPATGEGIYPAVVSALALSQALSSRDPGTWYARLVNPLVRQVRLQRRLVKLVGRVLEKGGSVSALADDSVLRAYIEENLGWGLLLRAAIRRPTAAASLIKSLLRR